MRKPLRALRDANSDAPAGRSLALIAAVDTGDLPTASRMLAAAVKRTPTNAPLRARLASVLAATGDRAGAARQLATALRLAPADADIAARLGAILAAGRLPDDTLLDADGLAASLRHTRVDRDLLGAVALDQLARHGSLRNPLAYAGEHGTKAAARQVLSRMSSPVLRDPLLLAVLENCVVANRPIEELLAELRREILLSLDDARLAAPELARFATSLAAQAIANEYVLATSDAETAHLAGLAPRVPEALAGDMAAGLTLLRHALYRHPLPLLPANIAPQDLADVAPPAFRNLLEIELAEKCERQSASRRIAHLGDIDGETSLKVKAQYEASPYPRWRGVATLGEREFRQYLQSFFENAELQFLDTPFELLVAGCGTGCQAVSASIDYGAKARVLGLDLSAASLAYAAMMGERMHVANLTLAEGDIRRLADCEPPWRPRFQVIECCGVLHHMADPYAAWAGLLDCLAPGGLMLVGLYSSLARRGLETLRSGPGYPGAACSDAALRAWRQSLFASRPDEPVASYLRSRDAFTTSGFRDFFLHVSEQQSTLAEIQAFLDRHGLRFRGFVNAPFEALRQRFPDAVWPGRLDQWAALEAEHPRMFLAMYQFWVTRA